MTHVPAVGYDVFRHYLTLWAEGVAKKTLRPDMRVQMEFTLNFMQEQKSLNARRITAVKSGHFEDNILEELRDRDWLVLSLEGIILERSARHVTAEDGTTTTVYDGEVIKWAWQPSDKPVFLIDGTEPGEEIIGMTVPEARAHKEEMNVGRTQAADSERT